MGYNIPTLDIRLATELDQRRWDEFVSNHLHSSPYHLFAWRNAVEKAYGHKSFYLMAEENDQILGILPLIYFKAPLMKGELLALPYCDVAHGLCCNSKIYEKLICEAVTLGKELKAIRLEIRDQANWLPINQIPHPPFLTLTNKVRMIMELPDSSETLWKNFKSKLRSQIRKAEKNGLNFSWGNSTHVDDFYSVFCTNMRDLGSPVHAKKWFQAILSYYKEKALMGFVRYGQKPVSAGIILSVGQKISVPWASTLNTYNKLAPNMLLYWNFLKYATDHGYKTFDFGRSTLNEGTYKFKAQWGARPSPLSWNKIHLNGKPVGPENNITSKREKAEYIWKKLPLPVANALGPILRKYINL